jgi:hypothetical protein
LRHHAALETRQIIGPAGLAAQYGKPKIRETMAILSADPPSGAPESDSIALKQSLAFSFDRA